MSVNINALINEVPPSEALDQRLVSTSDAVLSRRQVRIIPRERSSFGSQTAAGVVSTDSLSDRLTFYINDDSGYLDTQNMYFTTKFKAKAQATGPVVDLPNRYLDVGGIHSSIKEVKLTLNGQVIERIREYSKIYAALSLASHSPEHVDYVLGTSGDSMNSMYKQGDAPRKYMDVSIVTAEATYTNSTKILHLSTASSKAESELKVGDELAVSFGLTTLPTQAETKLVRVLVITDDNNITVDGLSADIPVATIQSVQIVGFAGKSARHQVADGNEYKLTFKINLDFFKQHKYFPLRFIKGPLELEIEFNDSQNVIVLRDKADRATTNGFGYYWLEPRLIAPIVQMDKEMVVSKHEAIYNNQGLVFPYMSFEHHSKSVGESVATATVNNNSFLSNLKNARYVIMVLTDRTRANGSGEEAQDYACQSSFLKDGIIDYRFVAGANSFPEYDKVDVSTIFGSEAWEQLMLSMNKSGNILHDTRISSAEWQSAKSDKFIMSTRLDKHEAFLTGLDMSQNYLESELSFSGLSVNCTLHLWVAYDAVLRLSMDKNVEVFK